MFDQLPTAGARPREIRLLRGLPQSVLRLLSMALLLLGHASAVWATPACTGADCSASVHGSERWGKILVMPDGLVSNPSSAHAMSAGFGLIQGDRHGGQDGGSSGRIGDPSAGGGGMIQIGTSITGSIRVAASSGGGGTVPVDPPAYYTDVPAVDLTGAGGSLAFPEGNNAPAAALPGLESYKGLLSQARTNLSLSPATVKQATFAIVRLPKGQRYENAVYGIMGNSGSGGQRWWLRYNAVVSSSDANRFRFYQSGSSGVANLISAPWTEDEALVVAWCDGAGNWQLDWYSLKDGMRYPGTPVAANTTTVSLNTTTFNIGANGATTEYTANGSGLGWPGALEAVGYAVDTAGATVTDPAKWSAIALGARLADVLPVADVRFVREFDGTSASFARPAWAWGDTTMASVPVGSTTAGVPGSTLLPGTTFRRQSPAQYLLLDPVVTGQVYGLMRGQTERAVTFSGIGAGFSGPVEVQVFEAETGRVVRDWTSMGALSEGRWSGTLMLPESENGWLFARARVTEVPTLVAHRRDPFGVGYKFIIMGQSQTQIGMFSNGTLLNQAVPMSATYADLAIRGTRATLGAEARWPVVGRMGMKIVGDGMAGFVNQFRRFKPKTPVMLYDDAVNGTSMRILLEGGVGSEDRQWADITDKLVLYGNDVTAVLWNWLMNEGAFGGSNVEPLMRAMFLPSGLGEKAHSLVPELAPGWTLGVLGGDRESYITGRTGMRTARIKFAHDNDFIIGPMVSDYRIEDYGGPHPSGQTLHGPARFGQRMAVMAARVIGADNSQNPYYTNARFSADRTRILVDAVAVNGGTIYSPSPSALRSWYVQEPADSAFVTTRYKEATAVLNGATVEITRASGSWPVGTRVMRMDDSEKRADGDGTAEDAIHAGGIYESWSPDPLGFGFPVIGSRDAGGKWWNTFEATP